MQQAVTLGEFLGSFFDVLGRQAALTPEGVLGKSLRRLDAEDYEFSAELDTDSVEDAYAAVVAFMIEKYHMTVVGMIRLKPKIDGADLASSFLDLWRLWEAKRPKPKLELRELIKVFLHRLLNGAEEEEAVGQGNGGVDLGDGLTSEDLFMAVRVGALMTDPERARIVIEECPKTGNAAEFITGLIATILAVHGEGVVLRNLSADELRTAIGLHLSGGGVARHLGAEG